MIQDVYQKAMKYAGEQHRAQKVPGTNANYLLHLSNVAMEVIMSYHASPDFNLDYAVQVAILHDTIEDTSSTYEEITRIFGEEIAKGVSALTKNETLATKAEMMLDSLKRINEEKKEVGIVKLADRITNLQTPPAHWTSEKVTKYLAEAKVIADTLKGKNKYLDDRIKVKIRAYEEEISSW